MGVMECGDVGMGGPGVGLWGWGFLHLGCGVMEWGSPGMGGSGDGGSWRGRRRLEACVGHEV